MKLSFIIVVILLFSNFAQAQSSGEKLQVFSSPEKTFFANAQSRSNAIQILNSSLGFAANLSITWSAIALGLIAVSLWDGDSGGLSTTSSTSSGN